MLTTDFKKMKDEEKQIVISRLSTRVDTTETVLMDVLLQMNPALSIENNKVWMSPYTLKRLHKKIQEYER